MSDNNYNPKITIEHNIRETVDIEVDLHDVMSAIYELPLTSKWNILAGVIRNLNLSIDDLTEDQKALIKAFLAKNLNLFNEK